jgi:hypothetical protein
VFIFFISGRSKVAEAELKEKKGASADLLRVTSEVCEEGIEGVEGDTLGMIVGTVERLWEDVKKKEVLVFVVKGKKVIFEEVVFLFIIHYNINN